MCVKMLQCRQVERNCDVMRHPFAIATLFIGLSAAGSMVDPCLAQTLSIPSSVQNEPALSPATGSQLPALPGSAPAPSIIAGTGPAPGVNQNVTREKLSPPVGRGLPGMPGGPALYTPMGAGDPSSRYMRPLVLGPVSCDLVADPACF